MDSSRVFTVDPNWEDFEVGAFLLALLAYPKPSEDNLLWAAAAALCAQRIRATCAAYPENADAWVGAYPQYASLTDAEIKERLKPLKSRFRNRMLAARMALGWLEEGVTGKAAKLPPSMTNHNLDQLAKLVAPQANISEIHLFKRRQWRPSLPVIHIAAALQVVMRFLEPGLDPFGYDIENENLNRAVISIAAIHEKIVRADKRFGHTRCAKLVSLSWPEKLAA